MSRHLLSLALLSTVVSLAGPMGPRSALAQETGTVVGMVYDSTTALPLSSARVAVMGTAAVVETDSLGGFRLTDVPVGSHRVTFFHPRLGELGVSGGAQTVSVSARRITEVLLAVPSRLTMLSAWCSVEPGPGNTSVGGTITDALTGVPLPRARVAVIGQRGGMLLRRAIVQETRSGPDGEFRLCNLDSSQDLSLVVRFGENEAQEVNLSAGAQVKDIALAIAEPVTITGRIVDYISRQPIPGASIRLMGSRFAAVTDSTGRFGIAGVPPGRQVIAVEQLGYAPRVDSLTVFSNEALGLEIELSTDAIVLDPIVVTGRSRGLEVLTTPGTRFDGLTEAAIDSIIPRVFDFPTLIRAANIPSLQIREVPVANAFGTPEMGVCIETMRARASAGSDACNMVEVRINDAPVPNAAEFLLNMNPQDVRRVQFINPLEAGMLYGQRGVYGVLLIYTR